MNWDVNEASVVGSSRQGSSHKLREQPCQDSWSIRRLHTNPQVLAMAVADGHGAKVHDLSEFGSQLAVDAAIDEFEDLLAKAGGDQEKIITLFFDEYCKNLVRRWYKYVQRDAEDRLDKKIEAVEDLLTATRRYGTTLLTAFVVNDAILLAQIGDGDSILLRPDGLVDLHQEQDAPELVGSMTFSMASDNADILFKTSVMPRTPGGILFLSTDGMANSFVNKDQYHIFYKSMLEHVKRTGFNTLTNSIDYWLDYLSENGSGDDISLIACWLSDVAPQPIQYTADHVNTDLKDKHMPDAYTQKPFSGQE
ncbi:MAG: protein phosphatase 2C domain-containing protein [Lentisphaeria bacterium]|nr:protein phosphatase 2C domain-containing protein [Lentisphaeria bacterium]NQZ71325.1 protein phosphatase 2C domain-containing protein [Lentisphaeria bacterium]